MRLDGLTVTDLIAELEALRGEHGDLPVRIAAHPARPFVAEIVAVTTLLRSSDSAVYLAADEIVADGDRLLWYDLVINTRD